MELNRKITAEIKKWYFDESKALLIKGARQVGKTHAIRKSLNEIGCNYIEINLIDSPRAIDVFFARILRQKLMNIVNKTS